MDRVPEEVLVIFDEAYYEFLDNPPDVLKYVREGRNVVVMRTFSKIQGLAGLRIGYGLASRGDRRECSRRRASLSTPTPSRRRERLAGIQDEEHMRKTRELTNEGREFLQSEFSSMSLEFVPSAANFVLVRVGDGDKIFQALLRRGLIVRAMRSYKLPEWIRVSVGTMDQNRRLIAELRRLDSERALGAACAGRRLSRPLLERAWPKTRSPRFRRRPAKERSPLFAFPDRLLPTIAERLFARKNGTATPIERKLHFGCFREGEVQLDEGMAVVFRAPRSYTGEDMAEFHCHGGVLVASASLEAVLRAGARAAEPGEFTQRAFLNGKMDLTQAEAVMDVIRASTSARLARRPGTAFAGRVGVEVEKIRHLLLELVAHLEAQIDFPEEGIDPAHRRRARPGNPQRAPEDRKSPRDRGGRPHPPRRCPPSSLWRAKRRQIQPPQPPAGVRPRDRQRQSREPLGIQLRKFASLRGISFRITDTAGLRETEDSVGT